MLTVAAAPGVLARHSRSQHGERLCTDVFTEKEVFVEAQTSCLVIVPDVHVGLTFPQFSDGGLPMVDVVDALTVGSTSTRKADEARFEVGNRFSQVFAQAVGAVLESFLREERHHVETDGTNFERFYHKNCLVG